MTISEAQKRASAKYRQKKSVKEKNAAKQKENFGNIAATFSKVEKNYIAQIFAAHGLKPAEVIRGAAAALLDGEPIRTESAPLITPQAAGEAQPAPAPVEDDGTDGGEE